MHGRIRHLSVPNQTAPKSLGAQVASKAESPSRCSPFIGRRCDRSGMTVPACVVVGGLGPCERQFRLLVRGRTGSHMWRCWSLCVVLCGLFVVVLRVCVRGWCTSSRAAVRVLVCGSPGWYMRRSGSVCLQLAIGTIACGVTAVGMGAMPHLAALAL